MNAGDVFKAHMKRADSEERYLAEAKKLDAELERLSKLGDDAPCAEVLEQLGAIRAELDELEAVIRLGLCESIDELMRAIGAAIDRNRTDSAN